MSLIMLAIIGMVVGYGILAVGVFAFTAMDDPTTSAMAAVGAMLGGLIGNVSILVFLVALVYHLFF